MIWLSFFKKIQFFLVPVKSWRHLQVVSLLYWGRLGDVLETFWGRQNHFFLKNRVLTFNLCFRFFIHYWKGFPLNFIILNHLICVNASVRMGYMFLAPSIFKIILYFIALLLNVQIWSTASSKLLTLLEISFFLRVKN